MKNCLSLFIHVELHLVRIVVELVEDCKDRLSALSDSDGRDFSFFRYFQMISSLLFDSFDSRKKFDKID
jgi:hypothetical protein